jgi:hypothetical protein
MEMRWCTKDGMMAILPTPPASNPLKGGVITTWWCTKGCRSVEYMDVTERSKAMLVLPGVLQRGPGGVLGHARLFGRVHGCHGEVQGHAGATRCATQGSWNFVFAYKKLSPHFSPSELERLFFI